MAAKLPTFDFSASSAITSGEKAVYPWEEWLDGDIWQLEEGEDFETHPLMMERIIRTRATARGAKVRLRHLPQNGKTPFGIIVVQRTDIVGPAQAKRAEQAQKRATKKAAAAKAADEFISSKNLKPRNGTPSKTAAPKGTKAVSKRPAKKAAAAAR